MKRVAIFVILAALTVGFSSCSAVRHCQAPEVEMPGQIASGYTDSLTIADLSWWQFYGDSTLRRVIELTLENNKDMLAAAARVEQMRQLYRISKAERLPNFSAKGLADYETNDYADEESSRDPEFSAKLSVSWELDLWGNLRWAKRKGGAEYLSSVEDWRAMRMTLVAEVATAYFQLMALDNELSIVRRTLRTRSEGVQQAQLRFEGGLTSETVYQQAKVEYASTATLIPDLESRIEIMENSIALLMGKSPDWEVLRGQMNIEAEFPDSLPVGLPSFGTVAAASRRTGFRTTVAFGDGFGGDGLCRSFSPADLQSGRRLGERCVAGFLSLPVLVCGRCDRRSGLRLRTQAGQISCGIGGIRRSPAGVREEGAGGFQGSQRCGSHLP